MVKFMGEHAFKRCIMICREAFTPWVNGQIDKARLRHIPQVPFFRNDMGAGFDNHIKRPQWHQRRDFFMGRQQPRL